MEEKNVSAQPAQDALKGVGGWLKFFVIVNIYVQPILFVLRYIVAWVGFFELAKNYPGIIFVGLIETGVGGFLTWKWIQLGKHLRDIRAGAVSEVKKWLKIVLGWNIISIPLIFMSGMPAESFVLDIFKGLAASIIGFAIWYSYFNVSKRVKATYAD